jgi:membrane fusion protein, heavy metal efflux system
VRRLVIIALVLSAGCNRSTMLAAGNEHGDAPPLSFTHHTAATELFLEMETPVKDRESALAIHLTRLADWKPVTTGAVTVVLAGGGGEERYVAAAPQTPGIFRVQMKPRTVGQGTLVVSLDVNGTVDRHELGPVTVHASKDEARRARAEAGTRRPTIAFSKEQQWATDFATAPVEARALRASVLANGTLRARPEGEAHVSTSAPGRLVATGEAFPRIGMEVKRDQVLAAIAPKLGGETDLASLELGISRARLDLDQGRRERERLDALLQQGAVPERRAVEARHQESLARAELSAAERRLEQYRGTQRATASGAQGRLALRSPIAGTIVAVKAGPGAFVEQGKEIFQVVDLDRIWLEVQIPEADIGRVRNATSAWFEVEGYERPFEVGPAAGGRLIAFGGVVDPETRTAPLLFELPNRDRALRVGMFARVRVLVGEPKTGVAIPSSALVDEAGQPVAYVQVEGETFERRALTLGVRDGSWVEVVEGVAAGERVVTRGAYQVRLATSGSSAPAHGHVH